ncbi:MAG: ATP-dependent Clp protease adaptor ClpS [Nitrospinaceae bacterium]
MALDIVETMNVVEDLPQTEEIDEVQSRTGYLPLYRIIMWDDAVTTMEFVVRVLIKIFGKDFERAERLMYEVHHSGSAHVVTLPLEPAEFKVQQVHSAAQLEGFPFRCTIESL